MMPGRFFLGVGTGENLDEHIVGARWPAIEVPTRTVTEDALAENVPCGPDPERHLQAIREYADAGFDHVFVRPRAEGGVEAHGMHRAALSTEDHAHGPMRGLW